MTQENKIVIEIPHPSEQLRKLANVIDDITQQGVSIETIQQSNKVYKEVRAQSRILKAYNNYLKFRIKVMEKKIRELERKESDA